MPSKINNATFFFYLQVLEYKLTKEKFMQELSLIMILILNKLHTPAADTTTSALDRASISSSLGVYRWQIVVVRSNPPLIKEFF